jgi:hypothetical protein
MEKNTQFLAISLLMALPFFSLSQTQTIRGTVLEKATRQPLIGATVMLPDLEGTVGSVTDYDGTYVIENVPVGRHTVQCSFIGFAPWQADGLVLTAVREMVLDIELSEDASMLGEVVVTATTSPHGPLNDAAVLSARSFSVEEVQHFAGAINDPGRMAHSLPGVQPVADSGGDIVVRGNASAGVLWRLEGVDILNPNHFARLSGSGGGLSIFSVSVLGTSDFFSGAFPSEYGNALAGAFDMRFRNGNREQRQHRFRAGMLGLELATEGPFSSRQFAVGSSQSEGGSPGGSYLVNYRYSTLGILNEMGIYLVSDRLRNTFQDLSFNLFYPGKTGKSSLRVWGTGGLSFEEKITEEGAWQVFDDSVSYESGSDVGILGLTHTLITSEKSHLKTTVAGMVQRSFYRQWRNFSDSPKQLFQDEDYLQSKVALSTFFTQKISSKSTFKTGVQLSGLQYDLQYDSIQMDGSLADYISAKGSTFQAQPFAQLSYQPDGNWLLNVGLHAMYFGLTESFSLEPRLSVRRKLGNKQSLSLATGLHSQTVPIGVYFANVNVGGTITQPNRELPLMKSLHTVLAYDMQINTQYRFHAEAYWQHLYDIPGDYGPNKAFWLLNLVDGFPIRNFDDEGKGTNIGLDLSLEKSFRKGFFFLLNTSIFNSTYRFEGSKNFNTQFNADFISSLTLAKEWVSKHGGTWQVGSKNLLLKGQHATPLAAQQPNSEMPTLDDANPYSQKIPTFFRSDLRVAFRKGRHSLSLDVQNVFNIKNKRTYGWAYSLENARWERRNQSGLVPVLSYQLDW